jgi:hypothetical protein
MKTYLIKIGNYKLTFKVCIFSQDLSRINDNTFINDKLQKYYKNYWTNHKLVNLVLSGNYTMEQI